MATHPRNDHFSPWRLARLLAVAGLLVPLAGCATMPRSLFDLFKSPSYHSEAPDVLTQKGLDHFNRGQYDTALEIFEAVKSNHPFSTFSLLAELKAADSNYYLGNYIEAHAQYEEFEKRHPTNEAVPYVLFQMGMCHYRQIGTVDRDYESAHLAVQAFARLLRTFPDTPYTDEAQARIKAARDFLAQHEYYVASFYNRTKSYSEAEGRLEYLLSQYPETSVAGPAREMLEAIKAGKPLKRRWIPKPSLPSWDIFSGLKPGPVN